MTPSVAAPAATSPRASAKPDSSRSSANAAPDKTGVLRVELGDVGIQTEPCTLSEISPTVSQCTEETHLLFTHGGAEHSLLFTSIFLDSAATLYRGPLDDAYKQNGHSFIVTDVDGDGHEDLIVWTGREGAYGGPSYDVLLFDPSDRQFYGAPAFSELTVGANGLFSVEGGFLKLSSSDGCCTRVFDTYAIEQREPVLVERVTEERDEKTAKLNTRTERLVDGKMQEVK
ncbi:FG-GAP repeat protein [Lysobacter sp. N42]|uniref:XAC2610-related protein n=1 Tax=Lysobacter sp. N42 TaxID=2545719 RepID=UPI00104701EF|nr:FG-GAP repeat protein [Lysobacter sp. N42]TCZ80598.1 hypothetical protein EYQ95_24455 [Lysobacter sp. N42]